MDEINKIYDTEIIFVANVVLVPFLIEYTKNYSNIYTLENTEHEYSYLQLMDAVNMDHPSYHRQSRDK
jgi:hypothetical protein